jgi:hypothetical protein
MGIEERPPAIHVENIVVGTKAFRSRKKEENNQSNFEHEFVGVEISLPLQQ